MPNLWVVMEFCPISLKKCLNKERRTWKMERKELFDDEEIKRWTKQLLSGLGICIVRRKHIVIWNLTIWWLRKGALKITDFGEMYAPEEHEDYDEHFRQWERFQTFLPPEKVIESCKEQLIKVAENTKDDKTRCFTLVGSDDIWRCGLILVELLSGCLLYHEVHESFKSYVPVCRVLSDGKVNGVFQSAIKRAKNTLLERSSEIMKIADEKARSMLSFDFQLRLTAARH